MSSQHTLKVALLSSVGWALIAGSTAYAQDPETTRIFDEIVVTAQKKSENSQDVPIAIAAFTGDALEDLGVVDSGELGQFIPGLEIATASGEGSQLIVFLRGAGLNDFNTNNSGPIAIYSDEVYISSPVLTSFQFFDTERLEVLKGPQGTLYGRNSTGGAIKFIANKPTEETEVNLKASVGNFGAINFDGALSGSLTDNVRGRFAVKKADSDGWIDNLTTGEKENGTDLFSWRGIVDVDVTDNFTLRGNLHGNKVRSGGYKLRLLGVGPGGSDALGYIPPVDPFEGDFNRAENIDIDSIGGYVEAKLDLGGVEVTSVTSYEDADSFFPEDTDSSPFQIVEIDYTVKSKTWTQELRLSGQADRFDWLLGAFYLDETLDQDQTIDLFRSLRALTPGGGSDPTGVTTGGAPVLVGQAINEQDTQTLAIFGQTDIRLTDRLTGTLGLRYTDEKREFSALGQLVDDITFPAGPVPVYGFQNLEAKSDALSWRIGLDYQLNDNALIFVSAARGFKSGGFNGGFYDLNPVNAAIQAEPYDPEFLTAFELGLKSDLLDNRLRFNAFVFYNDFKDLQVFTLVNSGALPLQVLDNSSAADIWGVELDAVFYPTDNFLLNLSASFLDSELKNFVANSGNDFSGNEIARTPKTSLTALARYDHDFVEVSGKAFIQGSIAYKSEHFFSTENNPLLAQEGYSLINGRVGYENKSDTWGVALYGKNLGNKTYFNNATDLSDFGLINQYLGEPRSYGVELSVNF